MDYNDNWYVVMLSKLEIGDLSEDQLRFALQPMHSGLGRRAAILSQTVSRQEAELTQMQAAAKYRVMALIAAICCSLLFCILLVWVIGLIIEALWLGVHVAANVQKIQEHLENG